VSCPFAFGFAPAGVSYANGKGVAQDHAEGVKWDRLAAEQGGANAQFNLGASYANGAGVAQDFIMAYAWCETAATRGHQAAANCVQNVEKELNAAERDKAGRLASEFVRKYIRR